MTVSSQIKQLSKDTVFYGLGTALQKFVGFFLFPIYTRLLTQSDFGAQDLVSTTITIVSSILIMGMDAATSRFYYDARTREDKEAVQSTWMWYEVFTAVPAVILLVIFAEPVSQLLYRDTSLAPYFRMAVLALPFSMLAQVFTLDLRLTFRSRLFSVVAVFAATGQALAAILLVVVLKMGIMGVFLAALFGALLQMVVALALTWRHFHFKFSTRWLKPMLDYGIPVMPVGISLWVLNYSNRYFLVNTGTMNDIAVLGAANKVVILVTFLISSFQIAWGPFSFSLVHNEKLAKETYSKVMTYFLLVALAASALLSLFGREAIRWLATPDYELAAPLIPWLCYGSIAWGAGYIAGMGAGIAKKSYHTTIATVVGAAVNILLNLVLIPVWGITGAAVATMAGNLVSLAYRYISAQWYFPVQYEGKKVFGLVALATLAAFLGLAADRMFVEWDARVLVIKAVIALAFVGSIFATRIVGLKELEFVWKLIPRKKKGGLETAPQTASSEAEEISVETPDTSRDEL